MTDSGAVPFGRARTRLALLALALGGFGIGSTEYVGSGLLPNIAKDVLPHVYAASPAQALSQAGWVISAYALGVAVGAPTVAIFAGRLPRKGLLLGCLAVFVLGSAASALAPSYGFLVAARFVAGIPHGAYFGVGSMLAADLLGPGRRGSGVAVVLGGLTVANVLGVPAITVLGQATGWRMAYVAVAVVFALSILAVWLTAPRTSGDRTSTVRSELSAFSHLGVWLTFASGLIGLSGFFAVESYIAPLTTDVAGLHESFVSLVLVVGGIGMTVGNFIAGHFADRATMPTILVCFGTFAGALVLLGLSSGNPVGLFVGIFLVFATGPSASPAIQTRVMEIARRGQVLVAASHHGAMNLGSGVGTLLGGAVIAAGLGYTAPSWLGAALCAPAIVIALVAWRTSRDAPDHVG